MKDKGYRYFEFLKKEIVRRLQATYPAINENIEDWKGQTITFFQEDLRLKVNEHISERWFYHHMKSTDKGLPRIDILNLLSRYAGYADWRDFVYRNRGVIQQKEHINNPNRVFVLVPLLLLLSLILFYVLFKLYNTRDYQICLVSADDLVPVVSSKSQIEILEDGESSKTFLCDSAGCLALRTDKARMRFVVRSPYYKTDTIERTLKRFNRNEIIKLRTDDYALMIHYFSSSNVEDWQKRREQLNMMLADSAWIYEVFKNGTMGIELYDKWEFINKLTIPSSSLKYIEILDTEKHMGKIVALRFTQKDNGNDE
jgi:hypothetical protein